jgi:hypothetical protein
MAYNKSPKKTAMPTQEASVRAHNFEEVTLGYTAEMAVNEAQRCLHCKNQPCVTGCPVSIHIPDFIAKVAEGKFEEAYQIISLTSSLPAVCGRVCPQETQCEGKCTRGLMPLLENGKPVLDAEWSAQASGSSGHRPSGALCCRLSSSACDRSEHGYRSFQWSQSGRGRFRPFVFDLCRRSYGDWAMTSPSLRPCMWPAVF